jgi:UDP-N-acetylmuramoyl-L-alanyl-D-glutamate--2,6-diaminopimelate ligase
MGMQLSELLADLPELVGEFDCTKDVTVTSICTNTADLQPGALFLATSGANCDRHNFIDDAARKGAVAVVVSKDVETKLPVVRVSDVDAVSDRIFQRFYANPQDALEFFAVTGTDGKTSVATIIWQLLGAEKCINIGTNGIQFAGQVRTSFNTTPDSAELYAPLREFLDAGAKSAVIEFSSEAQHFGRLRNLQFDVIGMTNITSDHLNTHGTLENYLQAKIDIFKMHLKDGGAVVLNADDAHYITVQNALTDENVSAVLTYGKSKKCTLQIAKFVQTIGGAEIEFVHRASGADIARFTIKSPLLGDFNVENLACALLMLFAQGYNLADFAQNIPHLQIAGRMQMINAGQDFHIMVDYAHTINGVRRVFDFVSSLPDIKRSITVIGQAGDRDQEKRPIVGKIVAEHSDLAIFTEDDPKFEDVHATIAMITAELDREATDWREIPNRSDAIAYAINHATQGDLVMVLGKGADPYMKVLDKKIPYSDVEEVLKALRNEFPA